MFKKILIVLSAFACVVLSSYNLHATSDSEWYIIQTENFNILFRKHVYSEAQRLANTLETLNDPMYKSFKKASKQRSLLVIDNESAIRNGYCYPGWMYFYTLPPQDDNNIDWLTHLALHELRHIVQWSAFFKLLPKHTIPMPWFFEGDAVAMETALSRSGRGRLPSFSILYRMNVLENKDIPLHTHVLGSTRVAVPDYYKFGYFISCYLRKNYGVELYDKILEGRPWPLKEIAKKIQECTGKSLEEIYKATNAELAKLWRWQLDGLEMTSLEYINVKKDGDYYENLYFPHCMPDQSCLVFRSDMDNLGYFASIDSLSHEVKILEPISNSPVYEGFSAHRDNIAWTENTPDAMWGTRGRIYSSIRVYNFKSKESFVINHNTRYAAVSLSPDSKKIAAIETDESYNHYIVVIDLETKTVDKKFQSLRGQFFKHPCWSQDGKAIAAVATKDSLATIIVLDIETGVSQELMEYSDEAITHPFWHHGYILYNSSYSGIDNIYAVEISTRSRFQVTCRPYGAYNASISTDGTSIYFNDFTKNGMHVARMHYNPESWKPLNAVERREVNYADAIADQENNKTLLDNIQNKIYDVYEYPVFKKAVSQWGISTFSSMKLAQKLRLGLVIKSSDALGILSFKSGAEYDFKKSVFAVPFEVKYRGWYPILKFHSRFEYPIHKEKHLPPNTPTTDKSAIQMAPPSINTDSSKGPLPKPINKLAKNSLGFNIQFPLIYSSIEYINTATIKVGPTFHINYLKEYWTPLLYKLSLSRSSKMNPRDIRPQWSQGLDIEIEDTSLLWRSIPNPYKVALGAKLLFPGLRAHDSLGVKYYWQELNSEYVSESKFAKPIGTAQVLDDPKYSKRTSCIRLEYTTPLFYIDKAYANLVSADRFFSNLIFEYLYLHNLTTSFFSHPKTLGIEFMLEIRMPTLKFSAGIRPTYTWTRDANNATANRWGCSLVLGANF